MIIKSKIRVYRALNRETVPLFKELLHLLFPLFIQEHLLVRLLPYADGLVIGRCHYCIASAADSQSPDLKSVTYQTTHTRSDPAHFDERPRF